MLTDQKTKSISKDSTRLRIFFPTVTSLLLGIQFGCNNVDAKKLLHTSNLKRHIPSAPLSPKQTRAEAKRLDAMEPSKGGGADCGGGGSGGGSSARPSPSSIPSLNAATIEPNNKLPLPPEPVSTIRPVVRFLPDNQGNTEGMVPTSQAPVLAEGERQFAFSRAYDPSTQPPFPKASPPPAPSSLEENYYELPNESPLRSLQLPFNQHSEAHLYPSDGRASETESLYDEIKEHTGKEKRKNILKRAVRWSNTVFTTNKIKR